MRVEGEPGLKKPFATGTFISSWRIKRVSMEVSELVEALKNPAAYAENPSRVDMLQTHISFVFLTDSFAYKVKKPVDFGFLDYTTLEKRRFYCHEEVRINSRLCEGMYLGVATINRESDGRIRVEGKGETVEYAVKMVRLPESCIMTRVLERGEVRRRHVEEIARLLSRFHASASTGPGVDEYGELRQVRANWVQNFEQTRQLRGSVIDERDFDLVEERVMDFMSARASDFERRVREGRIRHCHGDLHSGNIFILPDERICIFDAIEFYKGFSCCDVASEIAFLAMDLEFQGREDLAQRFVESYVEGTGDEDLLSLLDFYISYRAYVRAKVLGFKLFDKAVPEQEKRVARELVARYHELARRYALKLSP